MCVCVCVCACAAPAPVCTLRGAAAHPMQPRTGPAAVPISSLTLRPSRGSGRFPAHHVPKGPLGGSQCVLRHSTGSQVKPPNLSLPCEPPHSFTGVRPAALGRWLPRHFGFCSRMCTQEHPMAQGSLQAPFPGRSVGSLQVMPTLDGCTHAPRCGRGCLRALTHYRALKYTHTHTHTRTRIYNHTNTCTHTHTRKRTHAHPPKPNHTRTCTCRP